MRNGVWLVLGGLLLWGCNDDSDKARDELEQFVKDANGNGIPKISGDPPEEVTIQEMYEFEPQAKDLENDELTFRIKNKPDWAIFDKQTGRLWGQPGQGHIGTYSDVKISVTDGMAKSSLEPFAIKVNQTGIYSITLSWTAPTENEDGTSLTDLAGYRIYYGKSPGQYSHEIRIKNAGTTIYTVDNLSKGTYFFVATAVNSAGVESEHTPEIERLAGS